MLSRFVGVLSLASAALSICHGFNFAIGNVQPLGGGVNRWTVYKDNCVAVDGLTTNGNPCTQGIFGCSAPPILFNEYTNSFTGLRYACRQDPNSGRCRNDVISICCRNDGH